MEWGSQTGTEWKNMEQAGTIWTWNKFIGEVGTVVYCETGASFRWNREPGADLIICVATHVKSRTFHIQCGKF